MYILGTIGLLMSGGNGAKIADVGGQWGEEYGAQNFVVETDHNNPLDMLNYLKGRGLLE